ncbi:MAG: hypothetical protein AB7T59_07715 [Hyphomonadaceae bacterium]
MYGEFVIVDRAGAAAARWPRLALGQTGGRNEAWLRDLLISSPEILPVREIDPAFGPLVPLCTELRTEAGPIDAAFINRDGKLTIIECKLWRNPEARRDVVAQILDYARALSRWSYSDLQRQVSARLGRSGNIPLEQVLHRHPDLVEHEFIDATTRSLRTGRFLMIIMGDGIREDVEAIAELINRNAAAAFQLAVVEAALYDAGGGDVAVQTRVMARTRLIERVVVTAANGEPVELADSEGDEAASGAPQTPRDPQIRAWWTPVLEMRFDDPDQPRPVYVNNYVRAALPWPGLSVSAYRTVKNDETAVYVGGPLRARKEFLEALAPEMEALREELPGVDIRREAQGDSWAHQIFMARNASDFPDADAHRAWIIATMNAFANALRPRAKQLLEGRRGN